jgi:hypothetical protein
MKDVNLLAKAFSASAIALLDAMISDFEAKRPTEIEAIAQAVQLGARLSISLTATRGEFEIELACVGDYGDRRRIATISGTVPHAN